MGKKLILIIVLVAILISLGALIFFVDDFAQQHKPPKQKLFFTDKPENWVMDNPSTPEQDVKIDSFVATEGKIRLENTQQDYFIEGDTTSFFYSGLYKGNPFKSEYLPDNFFNMTEGLTLSQKRAKADEMALIRITNEFKSSDGIINGFILAREENSKIVFYIFVDSDWKEKLEYTNIVWGDDFSDTNKMHERRFDFSKVQNGVYIDKIDVDADWYKEKTIKGGIIVGEMTKELLSEMYNGMERNVTYIMIR